MKELHIRIWKSSHSDQWEWVVENSAETMELGRDPSRGEAEANAATALAEWKEILTEAEKT